MDESIEADGALELLGLRFGPLVAPDQSWADDLVVFVKQNSAVHLAGKTDGRDVFGDETRNLQRFANRESRGAPPVARVLLGPAGLRAGEIGVFFRAGGEDCAVFVEDYGASAACAYVDPEDWNTASFLLT